MIVCPGDIGGGQLLVPDGKVDIDDLFNLIARWDTDDCAADIAPPGGDNIVNIDDLFALIANWGPCACFPPQLPPPPLSQSHRRRRSHADRLERVPRRDDQRFRSGPQEL